MALEPQELIIVRRRYSDIVTVPKSGVWKIAYADFATAMMAFFLLMWLVNASDESSQRGIASYFNPIRLVDSTSRPKGIRDPEDAPAPVESGEGVKGGKPVGAGGFEKKGPASGGGANRAEPVSVRDTGENSKLAGANADDGGAKPISVISRDYERDARYTELQLFDNPYAILAALASEAESAVKTDGSPGTGGPGALKMAKTPVLFALPNRDPDGQGLADGTSFRDPFDPSGWQKDELPGNAPLLTRIPIFHESEEGIPVNELTKEQIEVLEEASDLARGGKNLPAVSGENSANSSVIVIGDEPDGAGEDVAAGENRKQLALSRSETEGKDAVITRLVFAEAQAPDPAPEDAQETPENGGMKGDETQPEFVIKPVEIADNESEAVANVAQKSEIGGDEGNRHLVSLANSVGEALEGMKTGASIEFTRSQDGVLIRIMDNDDFGMFAVGSSEPHPDVVRAMEQIAKVLEKEDGEIVIRGHTDARPFRSGSNDNWRLSTARAHMAYFMLTRGGLDENRIVGIEGYADRRLKNDQDPYAPQNRRIEIMLMKGKA